MKRLTATRAIAVFCSGVMAGLLFGDWLGPSFARSAMNASSFVQFQQIVHLNYLRTLPALSTLAVAAPILWLVMLRDRRDSMGKSSRCSDNVLGSRVFPRNRCFSGGGVAEFHERAHCASRTFSLMGPATFVAS